MNNPLTSAGALLAVRDAETFFRRHGNSLSEVLLETGGDPALDLFCETRAQLEGLSPEPGRLGTALRRMHDLLEAAGDPGDRHAAALRWHGARLSELASRLPG